VDKNVGNSLVKLDHSFAEADAQLALLPPERRSLEQAHNQAVSELRVFFGLEAIVSDIAFQQGVGDTRQDCR
jgi:hypothetical protein